MVSKVLIANRGEIVSRIIKTCKEMIGYARFAGRMKGRARRYPGRWKQQYVGPCECGDSAVHDGRI